jgi:hypothetical protein
MPQQYPGYPFLALRTREALIRALIWAFIGILYGMLFVFLAQLATQWGLPVHPYFFAGVLAATMGALIYSSMRLAVLLAIIIAPFCVLFLVFAEGMVQPHDLLAVVVPIGALIGAVYGHFDKASRVYRADAKLLAGFCAGFLVGLGYLVLSGVVAGWPMGLVIAVMCPLTGLLYVLLVPGFIRFRDDLLPPLLDGAMAGAGVAVFLALVFFLMAHSLELGGATAPAAVLQQIYALLPQAMLGGALGAGLIGLLSGLFLTTWQDL